VALTKLRKRRKKLIFRLKPKRVAVGRPKRPISRVRRQPKVVRRQPKPISRKPKVVRRQPKPIISRKPKVVRRKPEPISRKSKINGREKMGFLKKLGKGFKKLGKSAARQVTRPFSAITGKEIVTKRGTFFQKGFGRALDRGLGTTTKITGLVTAGVVGSKLLGGAGKGGKVKGGSSFFKKIAKSDFLKSASAGLKTFLPKLSDFNVSGSGGDLDSGFLGIGAKKREREETQKQRTFILTLAGIGIAAIGLLIVIFKK